MFEYLQHGCLLAAAALVIERLVGYPNALLTMLGHPVQWFGKLIEAADKKVNALPATSRLSGALVIAGLAVFIGAIAFAIESFLGRFPLGDVATVLLATTLLAQKSLREHVKAVHGALGESIEAAREQVAKIVGRDPQNLDESGISKAALESLAENTSDGIVAPALWFAILGLPGLAMYKMINTADSMIGHKSDRYLHFGWASARLDDLVNLPASRLTGYLFGAVAWLTSREAARTAIRSMHRDAKHHGSPNAGWPEAAMAGALGLRFGGTRDYDGTAVDLPWMGEGRSDLEREDIARGLTVFDQSMTLLAAGFLGLAVAL
jgi:adenosylcobinamide-phosphate synthase